MGDQTAKCPTFREWTTTVVVILLSAAWLAACDPDWRNVTVAEYRLQRPRTAVPLTFEVTGFTVDWSASMATPFHSDDEPRMMDRLETAIQTSFTRSGFLAPTSIDNSLGHLRMSVDVQVRRPAGSFVWQVIDGTLLIIPSLIGLPIGWIKYQSTANFELLDRTGNTIWKTQVEDEQNHYIAIYYGHGNISEPYRKDLRNLSLRFIAAFDSQRQSLLARLEAQRSHRYEVRRIRAPGGRKLVLPVGYQPTEQPKSNRRVEDRIKLAVMDLHDKLGVLQTALENNITDYLRVVAGGTGLFIVIDRTRQEESLRQMVKESKKESYKACYDTQCQIPLGMAVAADSILRSEVTRFGKSYILTLELVDLAREATVASATAKCNGTEEGFATAVEAAVKDLEDSVR